MKILKPVRTRILLTGLVMLAEVAHLAWEHSHGGVQSRHLLHRADLPAISNWWGALVLSALAWFLLGRILSRTVSSPQVAGASPRRPARILAGFFASLLFGTALAVAFTNGNESVTSYMFLSMFPIALLVPVYRSEYVLGFVLGMTFTFGVVLPTVVGCVIAGISALLRFLIAKVFKFMVAAFAPP
jgi:hypothetical protein